MRPQDNGSVPDGRRTTVVVAEDDPRLRAAMAELVSSHPDFVLVATASDAHEAIEVARLLEPDVMVMDVLLPRGPGVRVVRELSVVSPATRVVVLSGSAERNVVLQMLDAGAVGYLVEGDELDLLGALGAVARGHSVLSHEVTGYLLEDRARLARPGSRLLDAAEIRAAIDARSFAVAFQPIFSLRTGLVVGLEALCRLSPGRGLSPDMWFTEARAAGLDVELEHVVLASALESARRRPAGLFLSVNASPQVVTDPDFLALVERSGEDQLVVEITEHDAVKDYDTLNSRLREARRLGVLVAVDDVGAGYANFRHVLTLRPDMIKLDVTLTTQIDADPSRRALAKGIVAAAWELGARVVAEGIETRAQFDALAGLGVELGQGYYLGRPGPLPTSLQLGARS